MPIGFLNLAWSELADWMIKFKEEFDPDALFNPPSSEHLRTRLTIL